MFLVRNSQGTLTGELTLTSNQCKSTHRLARNMRLGPGLAYWILWLEIGLRTVLVLLKQVDHQ